jgi:hypothetical protein
MKFGFVNIFLFMFPPKDAHRGRGRRGVPNVPPQKALKNLVT